MALWGWAGTYPLRVSRVGYRKVQGNREVLFCPGPPDGLLMKVVGRF